MAIECSYRVNGINTTHIGTYANANNSISFKGDLKVANASIQEDLIAINEKDLYDHLKAAKNPSVESIEYGSKEWEKLKNGMDIFPPLNAPVEVRKAWQELEDSIPKDDQKARDAFFLQRCILELKVSMPEKFGLGENFELNTIQDYETLFNKDILDNVGLKEILKDGVYDKFIEMDKQFEMALDKYQVFL